MTFGKGTWAACRKHVQIDIGSVHKWCEGNAFKEDHAHGIRPLVTAPELLSRIN